MLNFFLLLFKVFKPITVIEGHLNFLRRALGFRTKSLQRTMLKVFQCSVTFCCCHLQS
jgi:hypothetical protein